jgi:hypothetical protein
VRHALTKFIRTGGNLNGPSYCNDDWPLVNQCANGYNGGKPCCLGDASPHLDSRPQWQLRPPRRAWLKVCTFKDPALELISDDRHTESATIGATATSTAVTPTSGEGSVGAGPSPSSVMMGASARSDAATKNCKHAQPDVQPRLQVGAFFPSAMGGASDGVIAGCEGAG